MAENTAAPEATKHTAGLFDIRFIIGALIGIFGLILVIASFFTSDSQMQKADDVNINLYAGLGMVVVAIGFGAWARLRPIVVPDEVPEHDDRPAAH